MMQQWYDEWVASGFADDIEFCDANVTVELPTTMADLNTLPDGHAVKVRLAQVLTLWPVFGG